MIDVTLVMFLGPLAILAYLMIAMLFGCPYCPYPDLRWPVTLLVHVFEDGDRS